MSEDTVAVTLYLLRTVYDELFTAAAMDGLSRMDVVNRAIGLYATVLQARPGEKLHWPDRDGVKREILILR